MRSHFTFSLIEKLDAYEKAKYFYLYISKGKRDNYNRWFTNLFIMYRFSTFSISQHTNYHRRVQEIYSTQIFFKWSNMWCRIPFSNKLVNIKMGTSLSTVFALNMSQYINSGIFVQFTLVSR